MTVIALREMFAEVPFLSSMSTCAAGPLTSPAWVPFAVIEVMATIREVTPSPKLPGASLGTFWATGTP